MAGFLDGMFASSPDDPRYAANMALFGSMMAGNLPAGLANYGEILQKGKAQQLQAQLANLQLQKGGLEVSQLQQQVERENRIRNALLADEQGQRAGGATPPAPPVNSSSLSTPEVGGVPMFSQGTRVTPAAAATAQAAPAQGAPASGAAQQLRNALTDRLVRQANIYAINGDSATATKMYEQAAKFQPEVFKIEVAMQGGQPVNVITYKDGTQSVSAFGATPKVHWADTGGQVVPVNEYTMQAMGAMPKTQTPDSIASNAVTMRGQNMVDARAREANAQGKTQVVETPQGFVIVDKNTGMARPTVGLDGKPVQGKANDRVLTDSQAKANLFGTRMKEADRILGSLEGKYSPGAVNAKVAAGDVPLVGGLAGYAGNLMLSDQGQQAEQAQRDFLNAVLRRESGAAISASEFASGAQQYFPQPGDNAAVLMQKRRNRQLAIAGLEAEVPNGFRTSPTLTSPGAGGWSIQRVN